MYNSILFACNLAYSISKVLLMFIPIVLLQSHQEISPEQPFSVDANGPVMACHSFRATAVGRSCDCRKMVGRGYLLQLPSPHFFFFFPAGDSPFAASLLEALSSTVLNVFSFWFGLSWARFPLSGFCLLQYYKGAWCLCSRLIICCVLCLISNECSLVFMDVLDPCLIFECFLLICFCLYRPAECLDAVLQREGQGNHLAGQASSFVLGYLASMLRELDPLSWVRDLGVLSEKFSLMC